MSISHRHVCLAALVTLAVVVAAAPAAAQEQVTVLRRGGERVAGRFEAWDRQSGLVYVRVTLGDQRRIPMADVALIDVGGDAVNPPAAEVEAARGEDHVLVTRGGEVLRGRLINIEGGEGSGQETAARSVAFQAGGERRLKMSEVARIYLGRFPVATAPAPAGPAAVAPGSTAVPGNQQWTSTGLMVRRGDLVQFVASGEIVLSDDAEDRAAPAGSVRNRMSPNAPAPEFPVGALIGRVAGGAPFAIGNQTTALPMPADGLLYLGINDDNTGDNRGQFEVAIRPVRRR